MIKFISVFERMKGKLPLLLNAIAADTRQLKKSTTAYSGLYYGKYDNIHRTFYNGQYC